MPRENNSVSQQHQHQHQQQHDYDTVSQRRSNAFAHLNDAKLGWFHFRAVLVSGVGFFTDAYDIFVIGQALPIIYQLYYPVNNGIYTFPDGNTVHLDASNSASNFIAENPHVDALLKASTNWGNLIGQLGFGYLGDRLGRKKMYGVELIIMIVCTLGSAMAGSAVRGASILVFIGIWRFCLGCVHVLSTYFDS
jgi:PHS family inorganic phosphate transporter-like MFS transporter